jgi:serine protease Do
MWYRSKQWLAARRGVVIIAIAALLVGSGLGIALAGGRFHAETVGATTMTPMATAPLGAPSSFADLAAKLSPSVVNIKVTKVERTQGPTSPFGPDSPFGDFFNRFFQDMPQGPREHRQQGAGSGFIISQDGLILTNNHVVEDAKEITVTLADKEEYPAKIIGRDPKTDLAVVKIEPKSTLPLDRKSVV